MSAEPALAISDAPVAPSPDDYDVVRRAIGFISRRWQDQPSLEAIAAHVAMPPLALQRLFTRWAGLTPKTFLQAVTLDHARRLLGGASVLEASVESGLSGPGRLHDLFVTHEAMTPGAAKARGAGLTIRWGFHPSPFGHALVMVTERGLAGIGFADGENTEAGVFADLAGQWPLAAFVGDSGATAPVAARVFDPARWCPGEPLRIVLIGSDFEIRVWERLLTVPFGAATTYGDLAAGIGRSGAARAVGAAVGRNPISFVVPCHRVLGRGGGLTGYRWGLTRKRAMLGWEMGMTGS